MDDELTKEAQQLLASFFPSSQTEKEEEDELDSTSVSSGAFDSGGYRPTLGRVLDTDLGSPVGNLRHLYGISGTAQSVELDEEGAPFATYRENRSFKADVIAFIQRYYNDAGELPPYKLLHETFYDYPECPRWPAQWADVLEDSQVQENLDLRGLPTYKTADNYLEPAFIAAVHLILNPHDKRTDAAKLKQLGIKTARWDAWLKRKRHLAYYKEHAEKIFNEETRVEAERQISNLVRNGDLSAIKYFDERTGVYRASTVNNVELVSLVIQAIMGILARNVPTTVINVVGAELRNDPNIQKMLGAIEAEAS